MVQPRDHLVEKGHQVLSKEVLLVPVKEGHLLTKADPKPRRWTLMMTRQILMMKSLSRSNLRVEERLQGLVLSSNLKGSLKEKEGELLRVGQGDSIA